MLVYYTNLVLTTLLNFGSRINKNKYIKIILEIIAIAIPSIIAGIRYNVGTDFNSYVEWFNMFLRLPIDFGSLNVGYNLLIKVIQIFTSNPQFLFLIQAVMINTLIFMFIKHNTKLYDLGFFLFIALYFYYSSLNISRQWIAIAIALYALKYAYNAKLWKFLIATIIAISFHITALVMIPIYLLLRLKLNKRNIIILILGIMLCLVLLNTFGIEIATALGVPQKYINYIKFDSEADGGGYAYLVFTVIVALIIGKNYKKYIDKNNYGEQHVKFLIITIIVTILSINSMIFNRLQLYFIPILMVCIPNLVNLIENKKRQNIAFVGILIIAIIYMTRSLRINGGQPLPYNTFFSV